MPSRLLVVLCAFGSSLAVWCFAAGWGLVFAGFAVFMGLLTLVLGMDVAR